MIGGSPPLRAFEAVVRGRVQGVGFRWFVAREAARLEISGWAANQPDGSVAVHGEGLPADIEQFVAALWEGPPGADVETVVVSERPAYGTFAGFEIRSGWHSGD